MMRRKMKLGIVSLLSVLAILMTALPVSAAGGVTALLQDVSPKAMMSVPAGKTVALRALAAAGSTVTASVNGQTVNLSLTSEEEDGAFWYEGTYTVPQASPGTSLGQILFTAKQGTRTETRMGGTIKIAEKNVTEVVDPPTDVEPVSGDMIQITADYADIFSSVDRGEDYAAPYYYNLPKGTIDYVTGSTASTYILKSGRRVSKTNAVSLGSGTKGNNKITGFTVDADATYTTITVDQSWNVPFNLTPTPLTYASSTSNTVTSCNPTAVVLTFDYTTEFTPSKITFPRNSAFTSATWQQTTVNGIPQLQLTLQLSQKGGYYGAYAKYNASGDLVLTFLNPVDSLEGARIVIDPGHGTGDVGTTAGGYYESNLNLQKAKALKTELEARGAEVYMLNTSGGTKLGVYDRVDLATEWMPHIYISVHHNSASDTTARGIEVYYNNPWSQRLAKYVNDEIFYAYQQMPYGDSAKNRGAKFSEFAVNRTKQFASILVEYGFMSNPQELSLCADPKYDSAFARATADGIEEYFAG